MVLCFTVKADKIVFGPPVYILQVLPSGQTSAIRSLMPTFQHGVQFLQGVPSY